jgi:hypothetical protein
MGSYVYTLTRAHAPCRMGVPAPFTATQDPATLLLLPRNASLPLSTSGVDEINKRIPGAPHQTPGEGEGEERLSSLGTTEAATVTATGCLC